MRHILYLFTLFWMSFANAQEATALLAGASERIDEASKMLEAAQNPEEERHAVTEAITAYEEGLQLMREGYLQTKLEESRIEAAFKENSTSFEKLIATLYKIENTPGATMIIHPDGPVAAARTSLLISDVLPQLKNEVADLKQSLEIVRDLREKREAVIEDLNGGLTKLQAARRILLSTGEQQFGQNSGEIESLRQSADTLSGFLDGLAEYPSNVVTNTSYDFESYKGDIAPPVFGTLLRAFNEKDESGVARPGVVLKAPSLSLVSSPAQALVRFSGNFLDYKKVVILEPDPTILLIFAGMERLFVNEGDIVAAGDALGLLGGENQKAEEFLVEFTAENENDKMQELYIEVRQGGEAVDPSKWFVFEESWDRNE